MKFCFNRKGGAFDILIILVLLVLLGFAIYFLYLNLPTDPVGSEFVADSEGEGLPVEPSYGDSGQFYDNMRFPNSAISYSIGSACDAKKKFETEQAFAILEDRTVLDFYPVFDGEPEIRILCSEVSPEPDTEGFFVAGEGGPTEVINTTLYSVILSGKASFFREEKCENPNIALHEILHVLGFDHNDNPKSVLFPTLGCEQTVDSSIVSNINALYSVKGAADLKVIEVDATKTGRYLDFNIEIINQGLVDTIGSKLDVYSDGDFIQEFDLGSVEVGTRKFLDVTNLKISKSDKVILFVVDEDDTIDEIFEDNNEVELILFD